MSDECKVLYKEKNGFEELIEVDYCCDELKNNEYIDFKHNKGLCFFNHNRVSRGYDTIYTTLKYCPFCGTKITLELEGKYRQKWVRVDEE